MDATKGTAGLLAKQPPSKVGLQTPAATSYTPANVRHAQGVGGDWEFVRLPGSCHCAIACCVKNT
jgi:hypothetical protein